MKSILIYLLINLSIVNVVLCGEINKYEINKIKTLNIGTKDGEVGWDNYFMEIDAALFVIDNKYNFYIPNCSSSKLNIYNKDIKYIRSIKGQKKSSIISADLFKFDNENNIISIFVRNRVKKGMIKVNQKGEILLNMSKQELIADKVDSNIYFVIKDNIYIYKYGSSKKEQTVKMIDKIGNIKNSYETYKYLKENDQITEFTKYINNFYFSDKVQENNKIKVEYLVYDNKLYYHYLNETYKIFKKIKSIGLEIYFSEAELKNAILEDKVKIDLEKNLSGFIGYDKDHNGYWIFGDNKILVMSRFGTILDAFDYSEIVINELDKINEDETEEEQLDFDDPPPGYQYEKPEEMTFTPLITVAPSGDVWFLGCSKKYFSGCPLWKVKRVW